MPLCGDLIRYLQSKGRFTQRGYSTDTVKTFIQSAVQHIVKRFKACRYGLRIDALRNTVNKVPEKDLCRKLTVILSFPVFLVIIQSLGYKIINMLYSVHNRPPEHFWIIHQSFIRVFTAPAGIINTIFNTAPVKSGCQFVSCLLSGTVIVKSYDKLRLMRRFIKNRKKKIHIADASKPYGTVISGNVNNAQRIKLSLSHIHDIACFKSFLVENMYPADL